VDGKLQQKAITEDGEEIYLGFSKSCDPPPLPPVESFQLCNLQVAHRQLWRCVSVYCQVMHRCSVLP